MPPPAVAIGQFLALAVGASQNKSRAELHLNTLSYVYRLNDWNTESLASGYVRDPVHASISIYSTATKQSAPVRGWMIRAILAVYCFGPHATAGSIVFSAGLAAMYHVWGRYDDASQLRFGGDFLVWHLEGPRSQHWLDLYICKHKNRQNGGTHHAIAASRDGSVGAFEAL